MKLKSRKNPTVEMNLKYFASGKRPIQMVFRFDNSANIIASIERAKPSLPAILLSNKKSF
ncbi:MAG TPA: hypothetical protein VNV85_08595 [Puia sp.]|nr:hypothetical protein [Puia sp.]